MDTPPLLIRFAGNPIITAADIPYRANSVFNPGAVTVDGETLLLLRVEDLRGMSHLTSARSLDGRSSWRVDPRPTFVADPAHHPEEVWGIEDPRITWIPEREEWAIVYTAYSRRGPLVSLALTRDFRRFVRMGPVMPPEDKDAALFPHRFGGRWALVHRPVPVNGAAQIWLSYSPDLRHWGDHTLLLPAREGGWWDAERVGLGPPPLQTPEGWLLLYHGARHTVGGVLYRAGLALLDLDDPRKVLHRSEEWVLGPSEPYERIGDVVGVVFPTGWIADEGRDELRIYYGAADAAVALATARLSEVLAYIRSCPRPPRWREVVRA
jgi:beta-1,4-mannooligosaccharide/beta-1,4-mannosyl-N-acetylglucosamine phosphorylase